MPRPILVRNARQLLTLRGAPGPRRGADLCDLGVIKQGAVLIENGKIVQVGLTSRLENLKAAKNAIPINAAGGVVLPGFVDSHTHLVGLPMRFAEAADEGGASHYRRGDLNLIGKLSNHALLANANQILKGSIRQGTTTVEAKSGYGGDEAGELKILKTHAMLRQGVVGVISTFMGIRYLPGSHQSFRDEYLAWLCDSMLTLIAQRQLAEFVDIECEPGAFDVEQCRRFLIAARQLGFGLKLHGGQFKDIGAVRLALELKVVSLDHLIHVDEADVYSLADSSIIATLLPGAVFFLGSERYAPARALIDRGVAVALATNYNLDTSPSQSMQTTITLACRRMKMTAAEAISAATINGAFALRRSSRIGSLEIGKDADLIILGVPDFREIPLHFGVNLVETTIKKGRVLYRPDLNVNLDAPSSHD